MIDIEKMSRKETIRALRACGTAGGEFRGGSWSVFGGPLHESMKVVGWWPLPEK